MAAVTTHDDPGTVDGRLAAFTAPGEGVNFFFFFFLTRIAIPLAARESSVEEQRA